MSVIYVYFFLLDLLFWKGINGEAGRAIQVNAKDYIEKYKQKLNLGDCPTRELTFTNGTTHIVPCPFKYKGDVYFIPQSRSNVYVKRIQNAEDVVSKVGGGLGVGAGVMGLVKVNVKVKATVDTHTNNKQLSISSNYVMQRGVLTLRNAQPDGNLEPDFITQLYLSEVVVGGEETLTVSMEFESEKKKTDVETTVTVKILFISITAKLRFIAEHFRSAAAVKIIRLSSWRRIEIQTFVGPGSLISALDVVKDLESKFKTAPQELQQLPLEDEKLHLEYHFNSWKQPTHELNFNEAEVNANLEILTRQLLELQTVVQKVKSYLNYAYKGGAVSDKEVKKLEEFEIEMNEKIENLENAYNGYFLMTVDERRKIADIYGKNRAPFYYTRKLGTIFQPGDDYIYLEQII